MAAASFGAEEFRMQYPPTEDTMETGAGVDLDVVAKAAYEANREYCRSSGEEDVPVAWEDAQPWVAETVLNGVRAICEGRITTPAESHASWLAHKVADGWTFGETKDVEAKRHPCLVPFDMLTETQQMKDHLFISTVAGCLDLVFQNGRIVGTKKSLERSARIEELIAEGKTQDEALSIVDGPPVGSTSASVPEIPDFAKPEDFGGQGEAMVPEGSVDVTATRDEQYPEKFLPVSAAEVVALVAAHEAADHVDLAEPPQLDDSGSADDLSHDDEDRPFTAKQLGDHIETAPENFELPEKFLPVGTDIHVEQKGLFVFKLPGQPAAIGRGRTIYGAMVNAGILK